MSFLKSNSLSRARLYFCLLAMLILSLACTPQHLNGKNTLLQKSSQSQLSPLHERNFGIKSLAYKPEEESNVIFLAASDSKPIRVATRRDVPKNMGIDLQDMTMNGANLPFDIQPAVSPEQAKTMRKTLLKDGRRYLKDIFKLIQSYLREEFLTQKNSLLTEKKLLPGKVNKSDRKDIQIEIKQLENQFHDQNKMLKNAFKADWKDLEKRIKTILPKPEPGFKTQALESTLLGGLSLLSPSLSQTAQQLSANWTTEKSDALKHVLGGIQENNERLFSNIIWLNEHSNPGRNIYEDSAVYKMINGSGQTGTLIAPQSEFLDQGLARKTRNSKMLIDETLKYLRSFRVPSHATTFNVQDIIAGFNINFTDEEIKAVLDSCKNTSSIPNTSCTPAMEVHVNPIISQTFSAIPNVGGIVVPPAFIETDVRQELDKGQKFILTLKLNGSTNTGVTLVDWLNDVLHRNAWIPSNISYDIISRLSNSFSFYKLKDAQIILSLESPEMCQVPIDQTPRQRVGTDIWLEDILSFSDLSNENEKSAVMAINQDNLLVKGTYKLRLKIKAPSVKSGESPLLTQICKEVIGNECILAEKDVTFFTHTLENGTEVEGLIDPSKTTKPFVEPRFKFEKVQNSPVYERTHIAYHIFRTGSDVYNIEVKPSEVSTEICFPIWDIHCVDYKKSLLTFNHQSLDTGVYSVIAKFTNPLKIRDLNVTNERRFTALHLQYATFAHLTDKPHILDAWGQPETDSNKQAVYEVQGINNSGYYLTTDQVLPTPPLESLPNTFSAYNTAVPLGSEIVHNALSRLKTRGPSFLSPGFFPAGTQNTLIELSKPHAEGMNEPYDAFRQVKLESCNQKRYLQIGFVANLHNRLTANNNILFRSTGYQPVYLEVIDTPSGQVRSRIPSYVKLGTQTYASVYWDGTPQNLTPDEEDSLPDDTVLDADGQPNYLAGEYTIRLSLPPDDEQFLTQTHLSTNFNVRRSDGYPTPATDVTWPTISPISSDVLVKIQRNNCPTRLRFVSGFETDVSPQAEAFTTAHVNYLIANELTGFQTAQNQPKDPITQDSGFKRIFGWLTEKPQPPAVYKNNLPTPRVDVQKSAEMSKELAQFLKVSAKNLDQVFQVGRKILKVGGPIVGPILDGVFADPVNPITILPIQSGLTYGNVQDPFCQEKPLHIRILAELQEYGPKPVQADYTVYRVTGSNYEEVYSDALPPIQPRSGLQEFVIPWDMEDESGNTLPPGLYLVVLEPKGDVEVSPQTTGATFGIKLIDPNAEAQQRIAQINGGSRGDFSTLAFNFQTGSMTAKETLLGMSVGITSSNYYPSTGGILAELDLAAHATPNGIPGYQGLNLSLPPRPLYGTNVTDTYGYVSLLTPYKDNPEYISLYDLAGLVYHLYRGQEVVTKALDNTKCRNPYIYTFLKTMDDNNGVKKIVQNDINRITPKVSIQNTSISDQNDLIKQIADTPPNNRLTFSNALHSLHLPTAKINTMRHVAGPAGASADVKFNENGVVLFAREHKNAGKNDNTKIPVLITADFLSTHINVALRQTKDDTSLQNSKVNVFIQTHYNASQSSSGIQNEVTEFLRRRAKDKNCKRDYNNFTFTIADPHGYLHVNEQPVCP